MKTNYLEEKLKEIHHEQNPQILDDDLPDAFDVWLLELDQNYILDVAYSVQVERDRIAEERGIAKGREEERERVVEWAKKNSKPYYFTQYPTDSKEDYCIREDDLISHLTTTT